MGTISFAAEQDIHAIRRIMDEAVAHLPSRNWFVDDDETYIARHIKENGYILKDVEENNVLAGYLIVDHPGYSEENLGRYLNLSSEANNDNSLTVSAQADNTYRISRPNSNRYLRYNNGSGFCLLTF